MQENVKYEIPQYPCTIIKSYYSVRTVNLNIINRISNKQSFTEYRRRKKSPTKDWGHSASQPSPRSRYSPRCERLSKAKSVVFVNSSLCKLCYEGVCAVRSGRCFATLYKSLMRRYCLKQTLSQKCLPLLRGKCKCWKSAIYFIFCYLVHKQ